MRSSPSKQKLLCLIGVMILLASAIAATYLHIAVTSAVTLRFQVLCALAAIIGFALFWHNLTLISQKPTSIVAELPPPSPRTEPDLEKLYVNLESRLEHTPIALFNVDSVGVTAINGNARRLIAPGRASNVAQLFEQLQQQTMHATTRRTLILFETEQGIERALLATSKLTIDGHPHALVALMPVESELQLEAQNAWLKLIHVLTHEIMNSLTPVASLSRTANDLLIANQANLSAVDYQDLCTALDAISRRARGLADFVSSYRNLSNLPVAKPQLLHLQTLLERVLALVGSSWLARGGKVKLICEPPSLSVMVDIDQFEQVLINLIKNAEEATAHLPHAELVLHAKQTSGGRMRLEISDNGPGIPNDLIPQIFTPFFSTKEHGSGIGLALARQLIQGNGGTVRYAHRVQGGALFIVTI